MLSCPIEYHRVENQISSFDVLIPQEHEFLKLLVARIAEKKPDIVLVEKSVSRIAQDMLLHAGISLMVNVKRSVLERISRVTGYRILSSVDETDVPNASGACKSASITRVPGKTIFTIIGSKPDAGCTILLRGKTIKELTKVKKILQVSVPFVI
jgi:1-phosphatidylinositol-3-phosphate 5-kinase